MLRKQRGTFQDMLPFTSRLTPLSIAVCSVIYCSRRWQIGEICRRRAGEKIHKEVVIVMTDLLSRIGLARDAGVSA